VRPLVEAATLRARLGEPGLVVVDCRFVLGEPGAGERLYLEGHVPGAAFLDVDRDLSAPPGDRGRHPLPEQGDFAAAAGRAGIASGSEVIAYDEAGEGGAARLWWLLRHFGHARAAVLNGGLRAWRDAGGELRAGPERIAAGDFEARARKDDVAGLDEVRAFAEEAVAATAERFTLIDARVPERFRGEVEPIDPVAGHIPGAANAPFTELAPDGRFRPPHELRARLGDGPLVAYCGSGITAATVALASELAGIDARLYPGGWSEWSRAGLPVATGANDG
jgi:thiosulfate/3-mercaptopyruvate sulfurtransferase